MTANLPEPEETNAERMDRRVFADALTLDLVSALSGDRELLDSEILLINHIHKKRGALFFSDILFLITHQYFSSEHAESLWNNILLHKYIMSTELKRNIKLVVAALDYLSNLTTAMKDVTLITERDIADIIRFSRHDGLTGLFNHTYFYQSLNIQMTYYARHGMICSLLMIDIDNFKDFNDRLGHQAGDSILATLGLILLETTRDIDICCRYGGEEFAVILPLTDAKRASRVADRLQARIAGALHDYNVTISIGIAACGKDASTALVLVKRADNALYLAKKNGKNQVVLDTCCLESKTSAIQ